MFECPFKDDIKNQKYQFKHTWSTWAVLKEVDEIMAHVPDWGNSFSQFFSDHQEIIRKYQTGEISLPKKKKSLERKY